MKRTLCVVGLAALCLTWVAPAAAQCGTTTTTSTTTTTLMTGCPLPATGQTTCWDSSGNVIPCAGTGHDGDLRKGAPLAYVDNGNGTITDVNTGLMWEKLSDDGTVHDKDNLYTRANAFTGHVARPTCSCTASSDYWPPTSSVPDPSGAW